MGMPDNDAISIYSYRETYGNDTYQSVFTGVIYCDDLSRETSQENLHNMMPYSFIVSRYLIRWHRISDMIWGHIHVKSRDISGDLIWYLTWYDATFSSSIARDIALGYRVISGTLWGHFHFKFQGLAWDIVAHLAQSDATLNSNVGTSYEIP